MNITKEITGALTALIKIEIVPADYEASVEKQISDYKRKANIPGFRPGHIPTGMIKKMYGKAILINDVNKLITENLENYIKDENIGILGNPLPNMQKNSTIDFENQTSFEFYFDLGLMPEFTIPVDQDLHIENYIITIDDEMVDKYIETTRKRFSKPATTESALEEVTVNNPDEELQTHPEEPLVEPDEPVAEHDEPALEPKELLVESEEPVAELAEMNAEFFNKVYPGFGLQTEEDFREQVRKDASMSFIVETDKLLFSNITEALIKNTEMPLPDEFLKRWLHENHEGKYTPDEIDKNYKSYAESIKWQLIENKLIREHEIEVKTSDVRNYIATYMLRQTNMLEMEPEKKLQIDSIIDTFMQNKEQVKQITDQLYYGKLMEYFKNNITFHPKNVTYDEYVKLASETHKHDHEPEQGHEHEHDPEHEHNHEDVHVLNQ